MLKIYCSDCGAVNGYIAAKPNFCQKCGQKFGHATIEGNKVQVEENEKVSVPVNLKGLEIDIEMPRNNNTMTLGQLIKTNNSDVPPQRLADRDSPLPPGKDIESEFKKEAGTLRGRKPDK